MPSNKNNSYKLAILVLSIFLLIVFFKSYKDKKSANEQQANLQQESLLAQNQLSEIIKKYDSVTLLYSNYDNSFADFKAKINTVKNSNSKIKYNNLSDLISQIENIKDSIKIFENKLKEIEKIKTLLKPEEKKSKIIQENTVDTSKFDITNLQVKGVKFLTDNITPNKKKEIEQIRVCFTVDKNEGIPNGEKEFFIQVINPKNDIVSVESLIYEKHSSILKFSKLAKFEYKQQVTDVCTYVDLEKNKTIKGRYIINIYSGNTKIGSTIFNYN